MPQSAKRDQEVTNMLENTDFEEALGRFVDALESVGVDYMLTGSVAMGFYAGTRMTRDIDVVIDPSDGDRPFLLKALAGEFIVSEDAVRDAFSRHSMFNVLREGSLVKIDAILRRRQLDTNEVFERRRSISFAEREVKLSSLEDLILAKLSWASDSRSEMQFRDIRALLGVAQLDREYLLRRVRELRLDDVFKDAQHA
jgi:hypothetical protein